MSEIHDQHVEGIKQALKELRQQESLLTKAQGLDEQLEKSRQRVQKVEKDIKHYKESVSKLETQREQALSASVEAMAETMGKVLPYGRAVFSIQDGKVFLGWDRDDGSPVARSGLSGGELVCFDSALAYALMGNAQQRVVAVEAAELDDAHLGALVQRIISVDKNTQILVNTCHKPEGSMPEGWNVIQLPKEEEHAVGQATEASS